MQRIAFVVLVPVLLSSCANGGKETRPQSEVKITAGHHLFGFRTLRGFGTFPVPSSAVQTDRGTLNLFDDSTYTVARPNGTGTSTTGADRYAIATAGDLSVYVTGGGSEPSVLFRGAYSQVNSSGPFDYFFTDRVSTPASPTLGLFFGTRKVTGQVELEGNWHLLSLHAVLDATLQSPENVGRGAHGGVIIDSGGVTPAVPGSLRAISGTGMQFSSSLTFSGTIQNLLTGTPLSGDGTCNLTVDYQLAGQPVESRVMIAAATNNLVFGLDADETDNRTGLLTMVRKFAVPAAPVDTVRIPGTFLVGGHTLFVNPANSGSDVFVGTVVLTSQGGFRLDGVGNSGQDFSYLGSYTAAPDGGLTITVNGTAETWFAAIDRSYNTLVLIDDFVETRSNNLPELNFVFGVRQKT
jgi:hypothetical protein